MTSLRKPLAIAAALLAMAPAIALACPTCAADKQPNVLKVVAVFLVVPFLIVAVVVPAIVRAVKSD